MAAISPITYDLFCDQFLKLVLAEKFEEAEKSLARSALFKEQFQKIKVFDAQLETLIDDQRMSEKIERMCFLLDKHGLATPFTKLCGLGAQIQLKREVSMWATERFKERAAILEEVYRSIKGNFRAQFMKDMCDYKPWARNLFSEAGS